MLLGHHISTSKGLLSTIDIAKDNKCKIYQIFLKSPKIMGCKPRADSDLFKLRTKLQREKIQLVIHGNYMLNFCNPCDSKIYKMAIKSLIEDLEMSVKINALGVIIHMGKNTKKLNLSNEEAVNNYVCGIKEVLNNSNGIIILETGAGQGTEICTKIKELGNLRNKFTNEEQQRIKFCIDTCHVFAAGYDLSKKKFVKKFEKNIEKYLGWNNVSVIHLNNSKKEVNCRVDRHADINKGCIELDGLFEFIKICIKRNIPMVLETPEDTYDDKKYTHKEQMEYLFEKFN